MQNYGNLAGVKDADHIARYIERPTVICLLTAPVFKKILP